MAVTKKIIGRIPICFGTWYAKQGGWGIKNRVTLYGSEFESLHENNTVPPAVYDDVENTVTFNENDWRVISNGTEAWLADAKIDALGTWEENPEFVEVCLDKNGRILYGVQRNSNFIFGAGVPEQIKEYFKEHGGDLIRGIEAFLAGFDGDETLKEYLDENYGTYEESPEFVEVKLDANGCVLWGIRKDGDIVFGCGIPSEIQNALNKIAKDIDDNFGDIRGTFHYTSNPEYLFACVDSENRFLYGITVDCIFKTWNSEDPSDIKWLNEWFNQYSDPEGRLEIVLDENERVLSCRTKDGTKVEEKLQVNNLMLSEEAKKYLEETLDIDNMKANSYVAPHLPKYGIINIKTETFYLTYDANVQDSNDVYIIQDLEDSDANASAKRTIAFYYVKSSLINNGDDTYEKYNDGVEGHDIKLDFYAATKVTDVSGVYYVTDTLVDGQPVADSVRVTQITDSPDVRTWPVDKKTEHNCVVDIDFGHYYSDTDIPIGIKFQGASTLEFRKRNLRFTFYKKSSPYSKKDKIKIGDMLRQSSYNLKANWHDSTRIRELVLYRLILTIWNGRPITDRFPWDSTYGYYTGATGNIKGFPVKVSIGGKFYGLDEFGLKKDEKNYMLTSAEMDGEEFIDANGMFVSGVGGYYSENMWHDGWKVHPEYWEDEMNDDEFLIINNHTSADNTALINFLTFINSANYTKENIPQRMDVIGWMDYFILMQVFGMWDNTSRNVIIYSDTNRVKMYPFFYDLDAAWQIGSAYCKVNTNIIVDILDRYDDVTLWTGLWNEYKDEIINRYCQLRDTVLNVKYVTKVYEDIASAIPDADIESEQIRWNTTITTKNFENYLSFLDTRLNWLDNNYFIV